MKKNSDFIFSIIILISFIGCILFLYLSFINVSNSNLFLSLALLFTIVGNACTFINKRKKKKEEKLKEQEKSE